MNWAEAVFDWDCTGGSLADLGVPACTWSTISVWPDRCKDAGTLASVATALFGLIRPLCRGWRRGSMAVPVNSCI
jgi:hypothetical protein